MNYICTMPVYICSRYLDYIQIICKELHSFHFLNSYHISFKLVFNLPLRMEILHDKHYRWIRMKFFKTKQKIPIQYYSKTGQFSSCFCGICILALCSFTCKYIPRTLRSWIHKQRVQSWNFSVKKTQATATNLWNIKQANLLGSILVAQMLPGSSYI